MPPSIRVAALQARAHALDAYAARLPSLLERVAEAAAGADLLVVPEGTFPAYVLGSAASEHAVGEATLGRLRSIARERRCAIVAGAVTLRDRSLRNSAIVVDRDGSIAGQADKIFLWHFDRKWFAPGEALAPVDTSLGRLGVMICADGRMPGIARGLVDAGAQLLVMPTAWVTSGRDPNALENIQADLLARVRAHENDVPFVAANKCGVEREMVAYCGKSQILDRNGDMLAIASERDEEILVADVTLEPPAPPRDRVPTPAPRGAVQERVVRVAITPFAPPSDMASRLDILDADLAIAAADPHGIAQLDRALPVVRLASLRDPAVPLAYRVAGYRCIVLETDTPDPWTERLARARAVELRMYVIVIETNRRAYAYDPDGACVAGTFDDYRIASFALDASKTQATFVAPGTDVAAGIERVAALLRREVRS